MADARAATAVVWPRRSKAWRSRIAATDAGDDVGAKIEQTARGPPKLLGRESEPTRVRQPRSSG